ncbi:glycerophosphodiester phosphodiesterase [Planctomonas psychrotolerans]|uniref:glycerophosphodiester phosphodiesterase n=1 Tax=Planctomonas psychrotolerans TaxID=2528712 RepID=UPI001238A418|nr:glycerophosphodiester phosphodiesterase [Planctomonas psychrotolerans]
MSGYFSPDPPRVIAHRGLALDAPENTALAFEHALALGITHLETDVRATSDGVPVLWHDETLERVGGVRASIADVPLEDLRAIDLGRGQRILTLAEALDTFPDAIFNIDVKSADATDASAAVIRAAGAGHRVLVTSFSQSRRTRTLRTLPGVATSASASRLAIAVLSARVGLTVLARRALRRVDAVQMPVRVLGVSTITPTMIRRLRTAVREVHVWTINDEFLMRRLFEAGVDGIVTDRADLARRILAS